MTTKQLAFYSSRIMIPRRRKTLVLASWMLLVGQLGVPTARLCAGLTLPPLPQPPASLNHRQDRFVVSDGCWKKHRRRRIRWQWCLLGTPTSRGGGGTRGSPSNRTSASASSVHSHSGGSSHPSRSHRQPVPAGASSVGPVRDPPKSPAAVAAPELELDVSLPPNDPSVSEEEESDTSWQAPSDASPPPSSTVNTRTESWLEDATAQYLDLQRFPLGDLAKEDVEALGGLMAAWARRGSARIVEQLLKRVVDDRRADPRSSRARPHTRLYTHAMEAWARSGAPGAAARAQQIHDALVNAHRSTGDPLLSPTVVSYNVLLNAWAKSLDPRAVDRAERILADMLEASHNGNPQLRPDAVTFTTILDIYSKSPALRANATAAVDRCEELFQLMEELGVKRNVYACSALQNVYARSGLPGAAAKAQAVLDEMLDRYHAGEDALIKPNCLNYNAVLHALSRAATVEAAREADALLDRMEWPVDDGGCDVEPDRMSYALTIFAVARCPDAELAAQLAEKNLEKMTRRAMSEERHRAERSPAAPPIVRLDAECFNVALTAISRSRRDDAYRRTMDIVKRMDRYSRHGKPELKPSIRSWNAVLNSVARAPNARGLDLVRTAESVMERIISQPGLKPNAFTFASVLTCYQRSPTALAERADALVRRMEELNRRGDLDAPPDVYHMTILCSIWARSGRPGAPDRCLEILAHMMDRHRAGVPNIKPNVRTYNAVLDCLCRCQQEERGEQLLHHMLRSFEGGDADAKPDSFSFNSVIGAYCRSDRAGSGTRAETVLDRLLEFCEEYPDVKPDTRSFTHIISHYARSRELDAPYRAEYMLHRLIAAYEDGLTKSEPNSFAFTAVMESYASAKHPDAGRNADRLLKLMKRLVDDRADLRGLSITTGVMNSVLHAWASCGDEDAGRRAEQHLDDMERSVAAAPDVRSYRLVLSAWSKSLAFDKAERALGVLRRLQEHARRGNEKSPTSAVEEGIAYSLVINACAFSAGTSVETESQAFGTAVDVLNELLTLKRTGPTPLAFAWFFQACGRLRVPIDAKESRLAWAFDECRRRGMVTGAVLLRLREAAPEGWYEREVLSHVTTKSTTSVGGGTGASQRRPPVPRLSDLPFSWSRHSHGQGGVAAARRSAPGRGGAAEVSKAPSL